MRKINLLIVPLLSPIAVTPFMAVTSCNSDGSLVKKIEISAPYSTIGLNQEMQCTAIVSPSTAKNKDVRWSVSDTSLASVEPDGLITSKDQTGTFTVRATAKDGSGVYGELTINVQDVKIQSIALRANPFKVNKNSQVHCIPTFTPATASNKTLDWSITAGGNIASIDANTGKVTVNSSAQTGDTITVKATAKDGSGVSQTTTITIDTTADSEDYETYIHDRSFSLLGSGTSFGTRYNCWGTCWIISDATPDVIDDYKYYIATNWHVVFGDQEVKQKVPSTFKMYFGDKTTSALSVISDYTQFTSYELEKESNFYYTSMYDAIDFYIAKADFASATGSIKTKLNKLNTRQQNYGAITEFALSTSDTSHALPTEMFIAGYPVDKSIWKAKWEKHTINPSSSYYDMRYYKKDSELAHEIGEGNEYIDTSPQYIINVDQGSSWMSGGASGSMLLGKADGQYKVYGIYWGGFTDSTQTALFPAFSIFNSEDKNFVAKYL